MTREPADAGRDEDEHRSGRGQVPPSTGALVSAQ
jgi:hypothetical protein